MSNLAFFCNYINRINPLNRTGTNNTRDNHTQGIPMIPVKSLWNDNKKVNQQENKRIIYLKEGNTKTIL